MTWTDLEKSFNRAFLGSFSWRGALLVFPALVFSGILFVFCRTLHWGSSVWVGQSLVFLPIFLSSAILLSVEILVIRMYQQTQKGLKIDLKRLLVDSLDAVLQTSYLSIPPILLYLLLWICLGIFFLIRSIPGVGQIFNTLFIFVPFLLIFASILLSILSVGSLFFLAPIASRFSIKKMELAKMALSLLQKNIFSKFLLFLIGIAPAVIVGGLLMGAALLTHSSFSYEGGSFSLVLEWFFMMFPMAAILTPFVLFFFHFANEAENLSKS